MRENLAVSHTAANTVFSSLRQSTCHFHQGGEPSLCNLPGECTVLHVRSGACEAARAPWFGGASSSHPRRFTAPWRSLLLGFPPHARRSAHHGCPDVAASLTERGAHRGMAAWPSRPQSWRWPSVQRLASTRLWLSGPRHCAGRPAWARVQDDLSGCTRC